MLRAMTESWHSIIMGRFSCDVILTECKWITTLPDSHNITLDLQGTVISRVGRAEGINVLGAHVTLDNNASKAITACVQKGWAAFWKHRSVLCKTHASLRKRMALLDRVVRPAVMYCVGSLNPTQGHLRCIKAMHSAMLRKMLGKRTLQDMDVK